VGVEQPGAALSRDLSSGSRWDPDSEIDRFIERRSIELKRERTKSAVNKKRGKKAPGRPTSCARLS
jgi:hypothetical protein